MNDSMKQLALRFVTYSSVIAGNISNNLLSLASTAPEGAIFAATLSSMVSIGLLNVVADFDNQTLSQREKEKLGTALTFAIDNISKRLEVGETPRNDGFFDHLDIHRSAAEEIYEGVFQKCKGEHEDRKLEFIGHFLANVAFYSDLSRSEANTMLRRAEEMSYRQFCLVAAIHQKLSNNLLLQKTNYEEVEETTNPEVFSLLQEIFSLYNLRLVIHGSGTAILSCSQVEPNDLVLSHYANRFWQLFNLKGIPKEDIEHIYALLS